jgi:hypothetical protein
MLLRLMKEEKWLQIPPSTLSIPGESRLSWKRMEAVSSDLGTSQCFVGTKP